MTSLILDEKALKELNSFIQEMPVKYGLPLLQFINSKIAEQAQAKVEEASTTEKEKS